MKKRIAVMVDGGFFLKRYTHLYGQNLDPEKVVKHLYSIVGGHTKNEDLYRIFYYDCPPSKKKHHNPLTGKAVDFSKTNAYKFKNDFYDSLKKSRKVALRMGELVDGHKWQLSDKKLKELIKGEIKIQDLKEDDLTYSFSQKGVDMKLGLDIASLSYKKQVDRIVLISGDSDFVSAAKLARREGIDFILDPMWASIKPSLFEHIDGLKTFSQKRKNKTT